MVEYTKKKMACQVKAKRAPGRSFFFVLCLFPPALPSVETGAGRQGRRPKGRGLRSTCRPAFNRKEGRMGEPLRRDKYSNANARHRLFFLSKWRHILFFHEKVCPQHLALLLLAVLNGTSSDKHRQVICRVASPTMSEDRLTPRIDDL